MHTLITPNFYGTVFVDTVMVAFLLSLAGLAVVTALDAGVGQRAIRHYLALRLADTRLYDMLRLRHVTPRSYIDRTAISAIRAQLKVCHDCNRQDICDHALSRPTQQERNLHFCPNRAAIDRLQSS